MADTFDEEDDSGQWVNVHTPYGTVAMSPKRARRYSDEVDATYEARQPAPATPDDSGQWVGVSTPGIGKVYMTPDRARRYSDQVDADYESQRAEDDALSELAGAMDYSGLGKPAPVPVPIRGAGTGNRRPAPQRADNPEDLDALQSAMEDFRNRSNAVEVQNVPSAVPLASRLGGQPLPSPQRVAPAPERAPQQGTTFGESDTLQSAQNRERMLRGLEGMAGATSRMGYLIAGAKPPGENRGEAALAQDAGSQVRDYMTRRQQTEAEKATAEQAALQDPTSPASQRFQAIVSRAFGSVYTPEQIGQMTAADAPLVGKYGEMVRTLEDRAAGRTAEQQAQQAQLTARATEAERQRAFEGKQSAANRANALAIAGMRQDGASGKINPVPAGEAADLGEATSALTAADKVFEQFKAKAGGLSGAVGSFIPGTEAIQYDNDDRRAAAQVIGRFLEGGKLAAGDEVKYMNLMPAAGDSEDRAKNKIDNLKRLIGDRQKERIAGLKAAGYKTGELGAQPQRVGMQGNMDLAGDTVTIIPPPAPDGTPRPPKQVPRAEAERYLSAGATLANG